MNSSAETKAPSKLKGATVKPHLGLKHSNRSKSLKVKLKNFQTREGLAEVKAVYTSKQKSTISLLLNRANKLLGWVNVSNGGTCGTVVDAKIIFPCLAGQRPQYHIITQPSILQFCRSRRIVYPLGRV